MRNNVYLVTICDILAKNSKLYCHIVSYLNFLHVHQPPPAFLVRIRMEWCQGGKSIPNQIGR